MASNKETRQKAFDRKLQESYAKLESMGDRAGFVYVCVHDSWPNLCKIGCTKDPLQRIKTFSTYDPYDLYKMVGYRLVEDMRQYEKDMHTFFQSKRLNSEWFDVEWTKAVGILHTIGTYKAGIIARITQDYVPRKSEKLYSGKMNTITRHSK